jgi:hypothetical protein
MKTTRRNFIESMAAGGVYAALPVPTTAQSRWSNMKLAFQVYGVRDLCERDFASYAYLRPLLQQKTAEK